MGFRTSFYHYPIDYLESIKNTPRDENDWLYFEFEDEKNMNFYMMLSQILF